MIQGSISDDIVSGVSFATNIGNKWGPFGRVNASTAFVWGGFEPEMGLLYFSGQEGDYIFSLRATFAAYEQPATRPAEVRYEKYAVEGPDPAAATLSEFTTYSSPSPPHAPSHTLYRNLMSPTVSLVIGPNCTLFRTSQCILCRLPFFRAALQGGFLEASDQRITMPEDEPQFVAALIEFLYTGSYTYPYRASREIGGETAVKLLTPVTGLEEGVYHVGVYTTAQKYGSTELGDAALKAFMFVLRELKGIDVLNLWEAAYEKDLTLKVVEERAEVVTFRIGLPLLMRELYTLHPTEMREMSEAYPALLDDLCRMLVFNA
ncbi:hypothetical protein Q9L58_006259 [Maublancomyces gigas]|uniref:BTB domain-containing protein n=1 Tax=Discina gigas TaxID=1032678 RepID=A0ABR3GH03_9PEZI